ncbi:putative murein peptide carboxypeptidase [Nocardia cerradoensis]|uniref:Putative murein peptide carboxypeptidase n=2 Tax=Nocardia cerradoensis TaxID=85688 RepID=A0A231HEL6_9NOCA|nr:putative murein peptide carboxypeptidase [Nocardia cerradoensis]
MNHLSNDTATLPWARLRPGDTVRLVSPASFPDDASTIDQLAETLQGWGCRVEVADHALDRHGYMAGRDEDRVADLNAAYADPAVRAIITTRGGAGAYRLLEGLDYGAIRADPKPLVGFSDITYLHLAIWHHCRVSGIHGGLAGLHAIDSVHHLLTNPEPYALERNPVLQSAAVESPGRARGFVIGGALAAMAGMVGAGLADLSGAIVAIEAQRHVGLGHIDRQLTQLIRSGALDHVAGFALGRFHGFEDYTDRGWNLVDVLRDRLVPLGKPILGGLEFGHGPDPRAIPLGTIAELDTATGRLTFL